MWEMERAEGSDRFHPQRAALAAADAEGEECTFCLATGEFLECGQHEARTRHADRMAERDGPTVDVENFVGDLAEHAVAAEFFPAVFFVARGTLATDDLRGKRLVDLDEVSVLERKPVPLFSFMDRVDGAETHARRIATRILKTDELAERRESTGGERFFGHHQQRPPRRR